MKQMNPMTNPKLMSLFSKGRHVEYTMEIDKKTNQVIKFTTAGSIQSLRSFLSSFENSEHPKQ